MATVFRTCAIGAGAVCAALAIVLLALALAGALTLKRAEREPQNLAFARPLAEWAGARFSPVVAEMRVGAVTLEREPGREAIIIKVSNVAALDADGAELARFSTARFAFHGDDVIKGRFGPHDISVDDASLRVVRRADRRYDIDYGPNWRGPADVLENLTGGPVLRGAFKRADLRSLRIDFLDEASGRSWVATDASASVRRTDSGYAARADGAFDAAGGAASIAFSANYDIAAREAFAKLDVREAPLGDIAEVFIGPQPVRLSSMVSGVAEVRLSVDGEVKSSRIVGEAGAGVLTIDGPTPRMLDLDSAALSMAFDPGQGASGFYKVDRFSIDGTTLSASGSATLARKLSGEWRFGVDIDAADLPAAEGDKRVRIDAAEFAGGLHPAARRFAFDRIRVELFGAEASGALAFEAPPRSSPGIVGQIAIDGDLTRREVLSLWPTGAAWAARRFVAERVDGGVFAGISADLDLAPGAVDGGAIMPDAALALKFNASKAEVTYAPGMRPLQGVSGEGVLRGNSFVFEATGGEIGAVRLAQGKVSIPILRPKGAPATFDFEAIGDAGDILEILNDPPLAVLKDRPFAPEQFAGEGTVKAQIIRPNQSDAPRSSYRYEADAAFDELSVRDIFREASLIGASARVRVATGEMRIDGKGALGGAPVAIDWLQKFAGPGDRTVVTIEGAFGPALADVFGVPIRRYMRGEAPFAVEVRGDLGEVRQVDVDADLTRCSLAFDQIGWLKPPGAGARLGAELGFEPDGAINVAIDATGANLSVDGRLTLDQTGALRTATFDSVRFGEAADLTLTARRLDGGGLDAQISGRRLNIGGGIDAFMSGANAGVAASSSAAKAAADPTAPAARAPQPPLALAARLDELGLRGGVELRDAALDFRRAENRLDRLDFSARGVDGAGLSIALEEAATGGSGAERARRIKLDTENVGDLLAGVFEVTSVEGGEGGVLVPLGDQVADAPGGRVEARNFRIRRAPLLARIFAAGSLPGLSDLLTGDGIAFSEADARFAFSNGAVDIEGFKAVGPSVGMTASGRIAYGGDGGVDLFGAVAPAYGVNSLLGRTPLIGDLFVNRSGEGLFALSYDVSGAVRQPTISVNPLSALTPGVLRRMFEDDGRDQDADDAPPNVPSQGGEQLMEEEPAPPGR